MNTTKTPAPALRTALLGNGTAIHLVDQDGILCNRWGTVNGVWKAPKFVEAEPTCRRCLKLAPAPEPVVETITPLGTSTWRYQVVQDGPRWTVQSVRSGFIYARCDTFDLARETAIALAAKDQADADLERDLSRSE